MASTIASLVRGVLHSTLRHAAAASRCSSVPVWYSLTSGGVEPDSTTNTAFCSVSARRRRVPMALMLPRATCLFRGSSAPCEMMSAFASSVDARLYSALAASPLPIPLQAWTSASRAMSGGMAPRSQMRLRISGCHARLVMAAAAACLAPGGPQASALMRAMSPSTLGMSTLFSSYRLRFMIALVAASCEAACSVLSNWHSASRPCRRTISAPQVPSHARLASAPAAAADTLAGPVGSRSTSRGIAFSCTTRSLT
mmetsp:Transcript_23370/g.58671  ORF Transcript_23370/g.58671 Transcript_23370/m.58671 type:complete len:255 (+) Transcript_23370:358-1122(+)